MILNTSLVITSISQWGLFLGIVSILFGWIEKREIFVIAGQLAFLIIGLMAIWFLVIEPIYSPEIVNGIVPKQLKLIAFFNGVAVFNGFNVVSLLLKLFKIRFYKISTYILLVFAMSLFFMVFSIQQMAN